MNRTILFFLISLMVSSTAVAPPARARVPPTEPFTGLWAISESCDAERRALLEEYNVVSQLYPGHAIEERRIAAAPILDRYASLPDSCRDALVVLSDLATVQATLRRIEESASILEQMLTRDPGNPVVLRRAMSMHSLAGNDSLALERLRGVLAIDSTVVDFGVQLAILGRAGRQDEADSLARSRAGPELSDAPKPPPAPPSAFWVRVADLLDQATRKREAREYDEALAILRDAGALVAAEPETEANGEELRLLRMYVEFHSHITRSMQAQNR